MKFYIITLILILSILPAYADSTAVNTFIVNADATISVVTSGVFATSINAETGELGSGLNINYKITTNKATQDIRLRALVLDNNDKQLNAFCPNGGSSSSQNVYLVFASSDHPPEESSINDCKQSASTPLNNPDSIAYPGLININNNGSISYNNDGYFSCEIGEYTTDLTMSLATIPKPGTYDATTAMDEPDSYKVEIYLDNILE